MKKEKISKPKYGMWQTTLFMLRAAKNSCKRLLVLFPLSAIVGAAKIILELVVSPAILDRIERGASISELLVSIGVFVGLILILTMIWEYIDSCLSCPMIGVRTSIITYLSDKITSTSYPNLLDTRFHEMHAKSLSSCNSNRSATEDIWKVLIEIISCVICFAFYMTLISGLSPVIALIIILTSAVGYFSSKYINEYGYRHREEKEKLYKRYMYLRDVATERKYSKDIRIFGLKSWIDDVWNGTLRTISAFVMKEEKTYMLANVIDLIMKLLQNGIAYVYLIRLMLGNGISVAVFLLYFSSISGFAERMSTLISKFSTLHKYSIELSTIMEFLNYDEPFALDGGEHLEIENKPYEIRLENVSYRYPGAEKDTLTGIDLTLAAGEKLAVVGLNGAGKTTLISLMCGFLDPTSGRVLLDGEDIKKYNRRDYYKLFSAVFQNFSVLEATLAENVAQTTTGIDMQRVRECVREAGLEEKVESLPNKYETHIGRLLYEDGVELSGGQTQRLMLARALYKNAPVLLLDEPTAALDPIAENDIYMKYNEMTRGRTSIFISHRLASTRFCDRIILVGDGRIAEEGTHEELLALGGRYAELFEIQSKYYKKGAAENENENEEE